MSRYREIPPGGYSIVTYENLNQPAIFAHRGSSAYAPENTLASFKLAVEQHADGIELDAKLTADGQVVVMHDPTVERTTNGVGPVNTLPLSEIKQLDAGSKFSPAFQGEPVPTLEEVFAVIGNRLIINVELTNYLTPIDDLPDKVAALIKKHRLEESVILSSFNIIALLRAHSNLPKMPLGLLTFKGLGSLTFYSKLVHFGPDLALHAQYEDVTANLREATRRKHCRIHAYTVNEAKDMERMFSLGVDGIFTRDPLMAQKLLAGINP